jgi:S1-C subfamily serine protease
LQLDHAELTDAALPHIARMKSLTYVSVRGGKFSREALRAFHRQRPKVSLMAMGEGMMGVMGAFNVEGCFLDNVQTGTAASEAGLQAGDKVISIEGEPVGDFSDLTIDVSTRKPGDALKVVYEREGKRHEVKVTLKARPPGQ